MSSCTSARRPGSSPRLEYGALQLEAKRYIGPASTNIVTGGPGGDLIGSCPRLVQRLSINPPLLTTHGAHRPPASRQHQHQHHRAPPAALLFRNQSHGDRTMVISSYMKLGPLSVVVLWIKTWYTSHILFSDINKTGVLCLLRGLQSRRVGVTGEPSSRASGAAGIGSRTVHV
ncbi:hypothetical protein BC834DRAFT_879651 [Gloeopeniophorella convolvens]|nr:hypothetical protein BC834DRAFT_879651 [Gloeopeniophorella convolvens]